jgi:tryptophan synthase alpha chain
MVGFGVKTPDMAAGIATVADGVIVATSLIDQFETLRSELPADEFQPAVAAVIADYRRTIDAATMAGTH